MIIRKKNRVGIEYAEYCHNVANVAKIGGLQSVNGEGETVFDYWEGMRGHRSDCKFLDIQKYAGSWAISPPDRELDQYFLPTRL